METIETILGKEISVEEANLDCSHSKNKSTFDHGIFGIFGRSSKLYPFKYFFGVEIENSSGNQISPDVYKLGLSLNKKTDGSITGREYTTGILSGDAGMLELQKIVALMKPHEYENNAGTHVHMSGVVANTKIDLPWLITVLWKTVGDIRERIVSAERLNASYVNHPSMDTFVRNIYALTKPLLGNTYHVFHDRKSFRITRSMNLANNDIPISTTIEFRLLEGTSNFDRLYNAIMLYSVILDYFENTRERIRPYVFGNPTPDTTAKILLEKCPSIDAMISECKKLNNSMKSKLLMFIG